MRRRAARTRAMAGTLWLATVALATPPAPAETASAVEDEVQPPETADAADAEVADARELDKVLCRKRGCCVTKVEDAGKDTKGHTLTVVTVDGSGGACLAPPTVQPEPFGTGVLDREPSTLKRRKVAARKNDDDDAYPDGEPDEPQDSGDCRPFEFHLVVRDKGKVRSRQLLSQACNDGHGTAGAGEDLIAVDAHARTFTHTQSGGSAWRGDHSITVGLDPLRIARVETSSFWAGDAAGSWQSTEWSWDLFSGDKTWPVVDCTGQPRAGSTGPETLPRKKIRAMLIPRVVVPAAFARDGWRTTSLGSCAILVDGDQQGFVVHGTAGKPSDASMRVVLSRDDVLFVEVVDDRWIDSASNWTKEDHIEVWMGDSGINGSDQTCRPGGGARQWGIRIADGTVSPGFGDPPGLSGVEAIRTRRMARLKIPLAVERAGGTGRLTVVYSDSDDGKRQKRLLATSQVERGRSETLGDLWEVDPAQASCVEKGKALSVARVPLRPRQNQPVGQP